MRSRRPAVGRAARTTADIIGIVSSSLLLLLLSALLRLFEVKYVLLTRYAVRSHPTERLSTQTSVWRRDGQRERRHAHEALAMEIQALGVVPAASADSSS